MGDLQPILDVEMNNAIRELKKIWETSEIDEISVLIKVKEASSYYDKFEIYLSSFGVWCCLDYYKKKYIWLDSSVLLREAKRQFSPSVLLQLPDVHFKMLFLTHFPLIKKNIELEIIKVREKKHIGMALINDVLNEFSSSREEEQVSDGNKITIIDFGYRTVQIINNGCFILDDKRQQQGEKEETSKRVRTKIEYSMFNEMSKKLSDNNKKLLKKFKNNWL